MSYTGDLSDPAETVYTLDYYLKLAEQIVDAGAHVLAIKDMAGLLRARGDHAGLCAAQPVRPARARAHPRHSGRAAGHLHRGVAGRRQRGRRRCGAAGRHHQPAALSSIVAAAAHTRYDTGLSLRAICDLEPYWEALRKVYAPFESGALPAPTGRVYTLEIPGGQLSNLRQQAIALGTGGPVRGHRERLRRRRPRSWATW